MKILIDLNLSPTWVPVFQDAGFEAVHWSAVGDPRAPDEIILSWARAEGFIVFTNDLDFGAILAATAQPGPSVFQIRSQDVTPRRMSPLVLKALADYRSFLESGALVTIDEGSSRVRILPFGS